MRHFEIVYKGLSKSEPPEHPFRTATLFVPRGLSEACIALIEKHGCKVIKTRFLARYDAISVDVEAETPEAAADLLFAWVRRSRRIVAMVRSGKSVLDTLSELIDREGEQ